MYRNKCRYRYVIANKYRLFKKLYRQLIVAMFCVNLVGCTNGTLSSTGSNSGFNSGFQQLYQFNGTTSNVIISGTSQSFTVMTVEFFFQTTLFVNQYLLSTNFSSIYININAAGQVGVDAPNTTCAGNFGLQATAAAYNDGNMHHLAATFNSAGAHYLFIDGVQVLSFTPTAYGSCTLTSLYIGSNLAATNWFNGKMDEFRVSSNIRYTGNFSVPAAPFQNDLSTLDLFHFNTSQTNDSLTGGGIYNPINITIINR
jgi:hypothetical protein